MQEGGRIGYNMTVNMNCSQLGGNTHGRPKIIRRKHPCLSGQPDSGRKKHIHHGKVSPGCLCFFSLCWCKTCNKGIKKALVGAGYAVCSVNSMLGSINSLLSFLGWINCKVKNLRIQQQTYCVEEKEVLILHRRRIFQNMAAKITLCTLLVLKLAERAGFARSKLSIPDECS